MSEDTALPVPPEVEEEEALHDEDYARAVILAWGKPIPTNWDKDKLKFFDAVKHSPEIKALARGLSIEEALNFYGLIPDILNEYEALFFVTTYLKGRMKAKNDAVAALFSSMRDNVGNAGMQASLAYLRRFAANFQGNEDADSSNIKGIKIEVVE